MASDRNKTARVSLANYDGKRVLNSPTSLEACHLEGVVPESLVIAASTSNMGDDAAPRHDLSTPLAAVKAKTQEQKEAKRKFIENRRRAQLDLVTATYHKLVERKNATKPATAVPNPPKTARGAAGGNTSPKSARGVAAATDGAAADGDDSADVEVAQYFLQLRREADARAEKQRKWAEKLAAIERVRQQAESKRLAEAEEKGKALSEHLESARRCHTARTEEKLQATLRSVSKHEARTLSLTESRKRKHPHSPPRREVQSRERVAAEEIAAKKLEDLKARLSKAQDASRQSLEKVEREREARAFGLELQATAHREQAVRASRANEFRREQLEQRILAAASRRDEVDDLQRQQREQRALHRERVAKQKEAVAEYVRQMAAAAAASNGSSNGTATAPLPPPKWLEPQLKRLQEKNSSSGAGGPQTPRAPLSPRAPQQGPRSEQQQNNSWKTREKWTISSSVSDKQAFPKWMYQVD